MRKHVLIFFVALMLILAIFTLVACSGNDSTTSTPQNNIDNNPSGDQGGNQPSGGDQPSGNQPSGGDNSGNQPSGGDNGQGNPDTNTTPNPPAPTYTVVQSTVNLGDYTINIPDNAKSIGIVADIEPDSATTSADDDETHLLGYLAAFDEYNKLLTGKGGRISFTTTRKYYYKHATETATVLDESGEPLVDENGEVITQDIYVLDENENYVYELDEHGDKIPLLDEDGNYVFAEDCEDDKEVFGEVEVELLQEDFGMSVIKIKVIRNFIFICFALPVPDECYETNNTYTMLLADGTVFEFTRRDLPALRGDNDNNYDVTNYTSDLFTQSYVINLDNSKIYPLNGVNIAELNEYGFAFVDDDKVYDIRLIEGDDNLRLIDISGIINDENTVSTHKDKNGIIYVESKNSSRITTNIFQNGTLPCVFYPKNNIEGQSGINVLMPYILIDKQGNAYINNINHFNMIIGLDKETNKLIFSEQSYGNGKEPLIFDYTDPYDSYFVIQYNYLMLTYYGGSYGTTNGSAYCSFETTRIDLSTNEKAPGDRLWSYNYECLNNSYSGQVLVYTFNENICGAYFILDTFGIRDVSSLGGFDEAEDINGEPLHKSNAQFAIAFKTFSNLADKYNIDSNKWYYSYEWAWYLFDVKYNGTTIDPSTVENFLWQIDYVNKYINFTLFMGKDDSFNDIYYYGSIDFTASTLPEFFEVQSSSDRPTRDSEELSENIIVIQPLN